MTAAVRWAQYREYSGCLVPGTVKVPKPANTLHMERAFYLTALIEAPLYGSVQSYDGAAMSAGPLHNIAVYPRTLEQGSLFALLHHINVTATACTEHRELFHALKTRGWEVRASGKLHDVKAGTLIPGRSIRDEFTPMDGKVPKTGALWLKATHWAWLFHRLFAAPATFEAQKQYSINWLVTTQKETENAFYRGRNPKTLDTQGPDCLSPEEDLAMCVYHCYSVNGPAPAKTELLNALRSTGGGSGFARTLLRYLYDNAFGNWRIRYTRTREAALASGLWPRELFEGKTAIFTPRIQQEGVA